VSAGVFVAYFVGNGLCDGLITRAGESYLGGGGELRACKCVCVCIIVCDRETSIVSRGGPDWGCGATEMVSKYFSFQFFNPNFWWIFSELHFRSFNL